MFDVFYLDRPTGLFAHERWAKDIEHARSQCTTRYFWIANYLCDYTHFDFLWEPPPWQSHQTHVWPSQHQANSGTYLIPRRGSNEINRDHDPVRVTGMIPRVHIKHHANSPDQGDINTRYISDYLGTLKRVLSKLDCRRCWVTSDVCDYSDFDFTWHPSEWQQDMLHVFASDQQQFGDTFYVDVPSFMVKTKNLALLEWFETLHFVQDQPVPRVPILQVQYHADTITEAVAQHQFDQPMVLFHTDTYHGPIPTMNLWRTETKTVMPLTPGASVTLVPRETRTYLRSQIYDFPYVSREHEYSGRDSQLDVVFVSNGESEAESNLDHLRQCLPNTVTLHVIQNVQGRVASQHAAARASTTPWYFLVPAKLRVNAQFQWHWQPDRLQAPKHYIFYAKNPITGLEYGHQAMVAYNRALVLNTQGLGLDFTMEQAHQVVPKLSGTVNIGLDLRTAWRTAFREAIKLKNSLPDVENAWRLEAWLSTPGHDDIAVWTRRGAQDGIEFWEQNQGPSLMRSYDWAECHEWWQNRYPDQA